MLAAAAVMAAGVQNLSSSPGDVIVTQKAAQAVEAVFAARDSHKLTWAQIRNVNGGTGSDGGVFLDGPHAMTSAGTDGLVNTRTIRRRSKPSRCRASTRCSAPATTATSP